MTIERYVYNATLLVAMLLIITARVTVDASGTRHIYPHRWRHLSHNHTRYPRHLLRLSRSIITNNVTSSNDVPYRINVDGKDVNKSDKTLYMQELFKHVLTSTSTPNALSKLCIDCDDDNDDEESGKDKKSLPKNYNSSLIILPLLAAIVFVIVSCIKCCSWTNRDMKELGIIVEVKPQPKRTLEKGLMAVHRGINIHKPKAAIPNNRPEQLLLLPLYLSGVKAAETKENKAPPSKKKLSRLDSIRSSFRGSNRSKVLAVLPTGPTDQDDSGNLMPTKRLGRRRAVSNNFDAVQRSRFCDECGQKPKRSNSERQRRKPSAEHSNQFTVEVECHQPLTVEDKQVSKSDSLVDACVDTNDLPYHQLPPDYTSYMRDRLLSRLRAARPDWRYSTPGEYPNHTPGRPPSSDANDSQYESFFDENLERLVSLACSETFSLNDVFLDSIPTTNSQHSICEDSGYTNNVQSPTSPSDSGPPATTSSEDSALTPSKSAATDIEEEALTMLLTVAYSPSSPTLPNDHVTNASGPCDTDIGHDGVLPCGSESSPSPERTEDTKSHDSADISDFYHVDGEENSDGEWTDDPESQITTTPLLKGSTTILTLKTLASRNPLDNENNNSRQSSCCLEDEEPTC